MNNSNQGKILSMQVTPQNVLIGGLPRSGTTLMASLVGGMVDVAMYPGEIAPHNDYRYRNLDTNLAGLNLLIRRTLGHTTLNNYSDEIAQLALIANVSKPLDFYDLVLKWWTLKNGKKLWGFKSPRLENCAFDALTYWKDSVLIYMVRDPRDVFVSTKSRGWVLKTPLRVIIQWRQSLRTVYNLQKKFGDRVLIIKYEDLVAQPQVQLISLMKRLGLDSESGQVQFGEFDNFKGHNSEFGDIEGFHISGKAVGRYQGSLSTYAQAQFEIFASTDMRLVGYEVNEFKVSKLIITIAATLGILERIPWRAYDLVSDITERLGLRRSFNNLVHRCFPRC